MQRRIDLIPAPTGSQPGGYVGRAYAHRDTALTRWAAIELRGHHRRGPWQAAVHWPCPEPARGAPSEPDRFVDAAALLAPAAPDAPWETMGAPGRAVAGALWRADLPALAAVRAEGLGTVARAPAPPGWTVESEWRDGSWHLRVVLDAWPELERTGRFALAVWRGGDSERGGLKSISPGWIELGA